MRRARFFAVCFVTVLVSLLADGIDHACRAQGVSVAPLRVLFDGRTRSATVFLSNRTPATMTYRISLVNRRMLETGEIVVAEESRAGEYFADDLIRYSPRRVTIAPFGSQTIRLLVRRPRGDAPEDVEYRTHLSIRSIPATPRLEDLDTLERVRNEGQLSVKAVATVETVIPILLRTGAPTASIEIANPRLVLDGPDLPFPQLTLDLLRAGNRSVYGELTVTHVAADGARRQIFYARGLAVYYPTPRREYNIRFRDVEARSLTDGALVVDYVESEDMHGDQSAQLVIPLAKDAAQAR